MLTLGDELFSFHMLCTLFVTCKYPQILVADHKHRRVLRDTLINAAPCRRRNIRCFTSSNRKRPRKHENLAEKIAIGITSSLTWVRPTI